MPPAPCEWATLRDLEQIYITIAPISMSSGVLMSGCTGWRERHLEQAVCCANDCDYRNNCVTYEPSRVPVPSELKCLGIDWGRHIDRLRALQRTLAPASLEPKWHGPPSVRLLSVVKVNLL